MKKRSIARLQYDLQPADLTVVLALSRGRTLAGAATRLGVDASTVFRILKRLERGLGQALFTRSRAGYLPTELGTNLAASAEELERALERARTAAHAQPGHVAGTVRISTTDTILHGLVAPALGALSARHPLLRYDLHTGNELLDIARRDADIALRATRRPPPHLVGKRLGPIRVAVYARARAGLKSLDDVRRQDPPWVAPDEALPEHPSVLWRRREFPKVVPAYCVNSILTVLELVASGQGVGVLPLFLADRRRELVRLTPPLADAQTELWLLTHAEHRHLVRVATVYRHLAEAVTLT